MADTPLAQLQQVARDEWSDPVLSAGAAARAMLAMLDEGWTPIHLAAVEEFRRRRSDSPMLLAITEAVLDAEHGAERAGLERILADLSDRTWADEIGLRIAHRSTLGVVSLGESTLAVLEAARGLGGTSATIFADRRAISRGLTYLGLMVEVAPPDEAEAVLIPAVAIIGARMWTTVRAADVVLRTSLAGGEVVVVAHPLAWLSARNRTDFRPASPLIDVKI